MSEYLDIVNQDDTVIGRASRKEIYEKLLLHRIAHVLVFNDKNELALQLRSKNVIFAPLTWTTSAGGHVKSGESYEEAAKREYKEELGVESEIEFMAKEFYNFVGQPPSKFFTIFKTKYNGEFNINKLVVNKVEFFTIEQIKKMVENGEKFHHELLFILEKYLF